MTSQHHVDTARREGTIFGIPAGDLGWFQSLIIGLACGFGAFFLFTLLGIIGCGIYAGVSHRPVDFAIAYRLVGFPVGVGVAVISLTYLAFNWVRRILRKGRDH